MNSISTSVQVAESWTRSISSLLDRRYIARIIIFSIISFSAILLSPVAGSLHLLFPAGCFLLGAYLFRVSPPTFVKFTFWLWILSPFLRRMIDYRSAYVEPSPVLLAPLLVMCLSLPRAFRNLNRTWSKQGFPFLLVVTAVLFGVLIGLFHQWPPADILKNAMVWSLPCLWGCSLVLHPESGEMAEAMAKQCIGAVVLTGSYAVYQFVVAPVWDRLWLDNLQLHTQFPGYNSFGTPEPLGLRVWSLLNSPGTFAVVVAVCVLMVLARGSRLAVPASLIGVFGLLLSQVRISWIALVVGLILLSFFGNQFRKSILIMLLSGAVLVGPLIAMPAFRETLMTRFQTFVSLSNDGSLNERAQLHKVLFNHIESHPLGAGLGFPGVEGDLPLDSGLVDLPYIFGWGGALLFAIAFLLLLFRAIRAKTYDLNNLGYKLMFVCILVHLPAGEYTLGASAFFAWSAIGFVLASQERVKKNVPVYSRPARIAHYR